MATNNEQYMTQTEVIKLMDTFSKNSIVPYVLANVFGMLAQLSKEAVTYDEFAQKLNQFAGEILSILQQKPGA